MLASRRLLIGERESARQGWTGGIFQWALLVGEGESGKSCLRAPNPCAAACSPARPACNLGGFIVSHMQLPAPASPAFKPSGTSS